MPDFWLVRSNSTGDTLWTRTFGSVVGIENAYSVQLTSDGGYILAGDILSEGAIHSDMYVVKTDEDHSGSVPNESTSNVPKTHLMLPPYPNPFNPTTTVMIGMPQAGWLEVNVFNVLGQEVAVLADDYYSQGYHRFAFDADGLANGIYFIRAGSPGDRYQFRKVVLMR